MEQLTETLLRTAGEQLGLLTSPQLAAGGVDAIEVQTLVRRRTLRRVRRGVLALADSPETHEQRLLAACLHPHTWAAVSHLAAANHWGLFTSDELWISVPWPTKVRLDDVRVVRSRDLRRDQLVHADGVTYTSPLRTLVDLGLCLPEQTVSRLVDHAIATRLVSLEDLWRLRIEVGKQGRNGAGVMGLVLKPFPVDVALAESGPEITVVRELLAAGFPMPTLQHEVRVDGRTYRIDLAYPEPCVAIEYDGQQFHSTELQRRADARRQRALESSGWLFVRIDRDDLAAEPGAKPGLGMLARIRNALRTRGAIA